MSNCCLANQRVSELFAAALAAVALAAVHRKLYLDPLIHKISSIPPLRRSNDHNQRVAGIQMILIILL